MRAYSILFSRRKTAEETPGANLEDGTQAAGVRVEEICVHILYFFLSLRQSIEI